ncbi:MAG: hypothetical protein A2172_05270 [Candidatus Woykebacteria bacterium RBG_13_40_15]|uniref:DUF5667 domain-containing protein n=1 Tax=Candidatus Woykebacteria bacterium RBG_13_40_15 TaxID=1802593 RepID=A0A1G1W537_9BACT|nr:MAG: hypothetical protein A2172_05270 [Candidatus Woykebacteria bacterium RBG_13_40_15]
MENENFAKIEDRLKTLANITPSAPWRTGLRSILLTATASRKKPSSSFALVMKLAGAGAFISVFLVSGTVIYAQNSLPGDLLYPVKKGYENIRLALTSEEDKFDEKQKLADKRIEELKKVVTERNQRSSDFAIKEVRSSVQEITEGVAAARKEYQSLKEAGKDTTTIEKSLSSLVPVLEGKQQDLTQIENALPEPQQPQIKQIRDALGDLQQKIENDLNLPPESENIENTTQGVINQPEEPQTSTQQVNP